jgi:hypothetical protein
VRVRARASQSEEDNLKQVKAQGSQPEEKELLRREKGK